MVARYCKEVRAAIKVNRSYKNSVIKNLEADLLEYLADHPDATEQQLRAHFGEPKDYAQEVDALVPYNEKQQRKTFRSWALVIVVSAALLSLMMWGAAIVYEIDVFEKDNSGYIINTIG